MNKRCGSTNTPFELRVTGTPYPFANCRLYAFGNWMETTRCCTVQQCTAWCEVQLVLCPCCVTKDGGTDMQVNRAGWTRITMIFWQILPKCFTLFGLARSLPRETLLIFSTDREKRGQRTKFSLRSGENVLCKMRDISSWK